MLPPFQGPDEMAHFAYVQHLAETGEAPEQTGGSGANVSREQAEAIRWENLHALVGVLGMRPGWTEAEERRWRDVEASLSDEASANGDGPNAVGQNPPLYYALETIPYHLAPGGSFFNRYYMTRLGSAAIYVAAVAFMWLIASELFRPLWARTLATAIVALQPKLAMLGAVVNADILLVLAWTAFIYAGLRIIRRGPTARRLAGAGAAAAASVLTHGRGLAILGALLVLLVIAYLRWRPERRAGAARGGSQPWHSGSRAGGRGAVHVRSLGRGRHLRRRDRADRREGLQRPRAPLLCVAVLPAEAGVHATDASASRTTASERSTSSRSTATSPRSRSSTRDS